MFGDDLLIKSAVSGAAAAVVANLYLYLFNLLFISGATINMPQLSAEFFLSIENYTVIHHVLGFIWSLVVGGTYAFIYVMALEHTGWKHLWAKAIIVISGLWLFFGGYVMKVMDIGQYVREEPLSIMAFYSAHLVFTVSLSCFIKILSTEA